MRLRCLTSTLTRRTTRIRFAAAAVAATLAILAPATPAPAASGHNHGTSSSAAAPLATCDPRVFCLEYDRFSGSLVAFLNQPTPTPGYLRIVNLSDGSWIAVCLVGENTCVGDAPLVPPYTCHFYVAQELQRVVMPTYPPTQAWMVVRTSNQVSRCGPGVS